MLSLTESEILKWDSDYFGFGVASIINSKCRHETLTKLLGDLKSKNVRLVYWASDPGDKESQEAAEKLGGILADKKTLFSKTLKDFNENNIESSNIIAEYTQNTATDDLIKLGISSGEYSRYKTDTKITTAQFEGLYKLWVINSVNRKAADIVFVNYRGDNIAGMVTVKKNGDSGLIGLIAVDKTMQGKNLGTGLVNKTLIWSKKQGCRNARVVTQLENKPACRLYEKCGYSIEKIQNFYHFWL